MKIGELSTRSGVPVRTIRFYEQERILAAPPRSSAGYRDYAESEVDRLSWVISAQRAGLKLAEIRSVLELRNEGQAPCSHTMGLLRGKQADIELRIAELRALRMEISTMINRAEQLDPDDCRDALVCQVIG